MKISLLWRALACCAILSACGKGNQTAQAPASEVQTASVVQSSGAVYRVATDATYPPFEFTDERGEIMGLDIDLLNAIAKQQGFQVEYYHHGWDGMFDELKNGKADILASAIAITDEAKEGADLSQSYFASPYAVVSLHSSDLKNNQWQKKKIAVAVNDDTEEDLIDEYGIAENQFHVTDTLYLSLTDVVKGKAQVAVGDATVMRYRITSPTFVDAKVKFAVQNLVSADPETDKLVFAVAKGNKELLGKINTGLSELKKTGELDRILKKWSVYETVN